MDLKKKQQNNTLKFQTKQVRQDLMNAANFKEPTRVEAAVRHHFRNKKNKSIKKKYVFNLSNASITGAGDSRHVSDS